MRARAATPGRLIPNHLRRGRLRPGRVRRGRLRPDRSTSRRLIPALLLPALLLLWPGAGADERPRLALVIDDLGWDTRVGERVLALDGPLTLAVLPGTPAGAALARRAAAAGHEVILHQPMEALDGRWTGPGAIDGSLAPAEIRRIVEENLDAMPAVVGLSNHMGSRLTSDPRAMAAVMAALADRGLYFLDSRTTAASVAERSARDGGLAASRRDVFLDTTIERHAIEAALDEALTLAERRGMVVVIGHPHEETLDVLEARAAEIDRRVRRVPASEIVRPMRDRQAAPSSRSAAAKSRVPS